MPTQANVALLEGLLDATASLVDTKKVVDKVEFDIQVLKNRLGMQGAAKTEETDGGMDGMDVDDGNDADGDADGDGEGEDGRAQSVVSTRSARSRKHVRMLSVSAALLLIPRTRIGARCPSARWTPPPRFRRAPGRSGSGGVKAGVGTDWFIAYQVRVCTPILYHIWER
jgi:hypothetical protein